MRAARRAASAVIRWVDSLPGEGYLYITHHAVWNAPNWQLVNVTPYPDPKHYPLPGTGADILFLVDDKAQPVSRKNLVAPLPMQFFSLSDNERLAAYLEQLNDEEQERCNNT